MFIRLVNVCEVDGCSVIEAPLLPAVRVAALSDIECLQRNKNLLLDNI